MSSFSIIPFVSLFLSEIIPWMDGWMDWFSGFFFSLVIAVLLSELSTDLRVGLLGLGSAAFFFRFHPSVVRERYKYHGRITFDDCMNKKVFFDGL